jgi:hypothetical protein
VGIFGWLGVHRVNRLTLAAQVFAFSAVAFGDPYPYPLVMSANSAPATVNYNGFIGGGSNIISGLTSQVTFSDFKFQDVLAGNKTQVTFRMNIKNNSASPITASRVSGLGFFTTPTVLTSGNTISGVFNSVTTGRNTNMPNQIGRVEFCFSDQNCAGGRNGGVLIGQTGEATATLYFANAGLRSLAFDELYVRYQSIVGTSEGNSASGQAVRVPEPGFFGVLALGLGGLLLGVRRYRAVGG